MCVQRKACHTAYIHVPWVSGSHPSTALLPRPPKQAIVRSLGPSQSAEAVWRCCLLPKAFSERKLGLAGEPLHTDGRGMEEGEALLPQPAKQPPSKRYANEVLYGIINAIVGAPTMISFAAIVYQVRRLSCMSLL